MNFQRGLFTMLVGGVFALVIGGGMWAQSPPQMGSHGPAVSRQEIGPGGPPPEEMLGFVGFEMGLGEKEVVKGAPYSAQTSVETTQVLCDGTHIDRKSSGAVFRDSEGRTRHEQTLPAIGHFASSGNPLQTIFINDPVAGVHYVLEPDKKIARKMTLMAKGEFIKELPRHEYSAESQNEITTESLGTQTMEGVAVEGTRITRTIPIGQIGNDRPIQIVSERWYSPGLQTYVMTKRDDPRMGTTIVQLKNISRGEPASPLFGVPADYTVREASHMGMHRMHRMEE